MNRSYNISRTSFAIIFILIASIGEFLSLFIAGLDMLLIDKIYISLIYVVAVYFAMFYVCVKYKGITNVYFLLLLFSVFFYYGHHILLIIDKQYLFTNPSVLTSGKVNDYSIIRATFLAIDSMLFVTSGFLLVKDKTSFNNVGLDFSDYNDRHEVSLKAMRIAAWICVAISIIPTMRLLYGQYQLTQKYGYLSRRLLESDLSYTDYLGVSRLEINIAQIFIPALYALMISYRGRKYNIIIYSMLLSYSTLYYMTGSRFGILKLAVAVFIIYFNWVRSINKKDIVKIGGLLFIVMFAMSMGSMIRNAGSGTFNLQAVEKEVGLSSILWESGITFTSIANILYHCPSDVKFFYGKSFLGGILQCLPNFLRFGFFDKYTLSVSKTFSPLYYGPNSLTGYGSSFIAEGYYNFGYFIYLIMPIYGVILGKIKNTIENVKETTSPYKLLLLSSVCGELVYGVRNDLSSIPRTMMVSAFLVIFVSYVIEKIVLHKSNRM